MSTSNTPSARRPFLEAPLTAGIAGAALASATWALSGLGGPVWAAIAKESPPLWLPRVTVLLAFLLLCVSSWALYLRRLSKEISHRGLKFHPSGGYYTEPKTGFGVCTRCLNASPRRYVHLMDAGGGLICATCDQIYKAKKDA